MITREEPGSAAAQQPVNMDANEQQQDLAQQNLSQESHGMNQQDAEKYGLAEFGDFSSLDELKDAISYKQKYSELESGFKTKEQEYQEKLKEASTAPKYKNEQLFKLSQIEDEGKANAIMSIVMNNASDKETYIQHLLLSKRAETREDAIKKFENKFPDLSDPSMEPTDSAYRRDAANLNDMADDIRAELNKEFEGIELPRKEEPISKEEVETSWKPFFGKMTESFSELNWDIEGGDPISIKLTPEEQESFKVASADYIYHNKFVGSADAAQKLAGMLKSSYLEQNFSKIANALIARGHEQRDADIRPPGDLSVNGQQDSPSGFYQVKREL